MRRIVGVEHGVAGFSETTVDELREKLGHTAWRVWQYLARTTKPVRTRDGLTAVTVHMIANDPDFVAVHPENVRRALKRLRDAGLLVNVGWCGAQKTAGGRVVPACYARRVRGAVQLGAAGRVSVPEETKRWMEGAMGHGGKRPGAGRPRVYTAGAEDVYTSIQVPRGVPIQAPRGVNQVPRGVPNSSAPSNTYTLTPCISEHGTESSLTEKNAPTSGASFLRFEDERGAGFSGSAYRPLPSPSFPLAGLPPYPGDSIVRAAEVPPPLKLGPNDPEDYRVRHLAACFRGAVERQYGTKCFLLANVGPKSKSYSVLAKAAAQLAAFDTAPAAWCVFAVRRWWLARTHTGGWKEGDPVPLPPVGVVFSTTAIDKRLSDDDDRDVVASSAQGGRLVYGKKHRDLLLRYRDLRRAVGQGTPQAEALARFFPGSSYDDLVELARAEAVEIRHRLEDEIKRGRMPW